MKGDLYTIKERIIKKIKIGRVTYKIYLCEDLELNNKTFYGFIDYSIRSIFLKKNKDAVLKRTLIHELTHAFIHEIYKNTKIKNKRIIKKLRSYEPFIEGLSFLIDQRFKLK